MIELTPELLSFQAAVAGEYSIERELGRGGMGIVYLARDVQLDRHVAIKVLPSHLASSAESKERFIREARTAAGLSHPNIVPIHRVGEAAGFVFFVMSYVPGETLGERLRSKGPMPAADAMRMMREVAWALEYAHERGIVHRDIKPDNILIEAGSGRALVSDFGIARSTSATHANTHPARIAGTAHFMSPEQGTGDTVDGRSDLYSLAVVGYLAVSGKLPFEAPSVPALMLKRATTAPTRVADAAPGVPHELAAAIDQCLATRPEDRLATGKSLADALQPRPDPHGQLPVALRSWLRAKNPAQPVFIGMFAIAGVTALRYLMGAYLMNVPINAPYWSWSFPALLMAAPILPMIGFHVMQGRRLFGAGYSLADLRAAIAIDERERAAATDAEPPLNLPRRVLRLYTLASAGQTIVSVVLASIGMSRWRSALEIGSFIGTMVFLTACNIYGVPVLPESIRRGPRSLRDRLWNSKAGTWIARVLGAPSSTRPIADAIFRPTEVALGLAAHELYVALPTAYREQLKDLPSIVERLEAQAALARARLDELAMLRQVGGPTIRTTDATADEPIRRSLGESVAGLENIRIELLRLHADESALAPLTTLLSAARALGEDVARLSAARREVDVRRSNYRLGAMRTPTPA